MKKLLCVILCLGLMMSLLVFPVSAGEDDNPFKDVKSSDYFYEPVLWALYNGVTTGTSATTFSPNSPCTRAQVVTFLWRSVGSPEPSVTTNPFKDVAANAYYYKAVLWAVEEGITTGTSATTFGPESPCTRAQVVTFLWRADGSTAPNSDSNPFKDVSTGAYYYNAVLWAVEKNITTGLSTTSFGPDATCSRAQIVTFLFRYSMNKDALLQVFFQPEDYEMQSSQELADFFVQVKGGTAPYTFEWCIAYDDVEVFLDPVTSAEPMNVLSYEFSDYDFDEYDFICVSCTITDAKGDYVNTDLARVLPHFYFVVQPQDFYMGSSSEEATFTATVQGGTAPYTAQWVVFYDDKEVFAEPEQLQLPTSTFEQTFTDYDFDDADDIGVYCIVTDANGREVESEMAFVHPMLRITRNPQDYQMKSSSEDAEFWVEFEGGKTPYSVQWVVCYDNTEVWIDAETVQDGYAEFTYGFTDYDFDDYNNIGVYCIITDARGVEVTSAMGEVLPKN